MPIQGEWLRVSEQRPAAGQSAWIWSRGDIFVAEWYGGTWIDGDFSVDAEWYWPLEKPEPPEEG